MFIFGIQHKVRSSLSHAAPHTKQVSKAFAVGVDQALVPTIADLIGAHPQAKLGKDVHVRYAEQPMGSFQRFLVNFGGSASVRMARSAGLSLPSWLAMVPQLAPELKLFSQAQPGRPLVYAYCFCAPR